MKLSRLACCVAAPAILIAVPAVSQDASSEAEQEQLLDRIEVTSSRLAYSAATDIEPEFRLSSEEIGAYGASSIEELLAELGPEIASSRGRGGEHPVILINGVRVSGFREVRNYPPEAIERMDVLPEEAALKFGYGANQRVINIVLKDKYSAITVEGELGGSTQGAGFQTEYDANYLKLSDGKRLSFDGEIKTFSGILEEDRGISNASKVGRDSLSAETRSAALGGHYHWPLRDGLMMTLNGDLAISESKSFLGLAETEFTLPAASPFSTSGMDETFTRLIGVPDARERQSDNLAINAGVTFIKDFENWKLTSNTLAGQTRSSSDTDRTPDASAFQNALLAGDPDVSPNADLTPFLVVREELTERIANSLSSGLLLNGRLWAMPAGDVSTGINLNLSHADRSSETVVDGLKTTTDLERQIGQLRTSFDLPLISSSMDIPGIEDLTASVSASASEYSDFGSLFGFDGTLSWSPVERVRILTSYTFEEGAPGMADLGDTLSVTPNVEIFDYVQGNSAQVSLIAGGNPDLTADSRHVFKLSGELEPVKDVSLRLNYIGTRIDDPIGTIPGIDAATQAAFPDRFVRDADGNLITFDARAVNFIEETRRDFDWTLSWRKSFSPSKPPEAEKPRETGQSGRPRPEGNGNPSATERGSPSAQSRPQGGGGGAGRGMGRGPGGGGTNVFLALRHNWHLEDKRLLADGFPVQDYLNGAAKGQSGGQSEHEVSANAGIFARGNGARLSVNWQSGTEVFVGSSGEVLDFSGLMTADLRLFYTLTPKNAFVQKYDMLKNVRLRVSVDNLFDEIQTVRDGMGAIPSRYAAGRLDPQGRVVTFSLRKQF